MTVRPKVQAIRAGSMPRSKADTIAPRKTALPSNARKFRSAIASSGVGEETTGGIRRTARSSPRIGSLRSGKVRRFLIAGMLHRKMNTEASRKGDQAFKIREIECCAALEGELLD